MNHVPPRREAAADGEQFQARAAGGGRGVSNILIVNRLLGRLRGFYQGSLLAEEPGATATAEEPGAWNPIPL